MQSFLKCLVKPRLHLFAEQLERAHHPVMRDFSAAIQFGEDAVEADLFLALRLSRAAKLSGVPQMTCVASASSKVSASRRSTRLSRCDRDLAAGAARRVAAELGLIGEKAHQAVLSSARARSSVSAR